MSLMLLQKMVDLHVFKTLQLSIIKRADHMLLAMFYSDDTDINTTFDSYQPLPMSMSNLPTMNYVTDN